MTTDQNKFELFMRDYQAMVFSTAVRLLGNEADAEDISQTVFLKAYENFAQLAHNPSAGGWLKAVATNLSLNHLSRYRARWKFFSELTPDDAVADFSSSIPAPPVSDQELAESEYRQLLEEALEKLPPAQRVPLVLFHFEEMSYAEIAARLKISLSKVKIDIHRGRLALARYLKPGLLAGGILCDTKPEGQTAAPKPKNTLGLDRTGNPASLRALVAPFFLGQA